MPQQNDNSGKGSKLPSAAASELKCMGEFPLFPGWLFFELRGANNFFHITVYGSGGRTIRHISDNREYAIAQCLRQILSD